MDIEEEPKVFKDLVKLLKPISLERLKLLETFVRVTADIIGDGCLITLLDADNNLSSIASAHRDRNIEGKYRESMLGIKGPLATSNTVSAQVARSGIPQMRDVDPEEMFRKSDADIKRPAQSLNVYSYVVVPIRTKDSGILGTLSLLRSTPFKSYLPEDAILAQRFADYLGSMI